MKVSKRRMREVAQEHDLDLGDEDDRHTAEAWAHEDLVSEAVTVWARWFYDRAMADEIAERLIDELLGGSAKVAAQVWLSRNGG